jgi:hypothetical protein
MSELHSRMQQQQWRSDMQQQLKTTLQTASERQCTHASAAEGSPTGVVQQQQDTGAPHTN